MNNNDRLALFELLGLATTALSLAGVALASYGYWRGVAGVALAGCVIYQVRIWLIRSLVKINDR